MWHLSVPKILHVYWGGGRLPYARFMTVKSFMRLNPTWEIMLWQPSLHAPVVTWHTHELDYGGIYNDYMPELMALPIESKIINFEDYGFGNTMSEVHKSDFIRLHILSTIGGVWSDMDIIFFKPIDKLRVNIPENEFADTFVSICEYGHSIGFFMATKYNMFFKALAGLAKKEFNATTYQGMGSLMFNKYFPTIESINKVNIAVNIGMEAVYPHDSNNAKEIYDGTKPNFTEGTIGLHWYAGSNMAGDFLNKTNGGMTNLSDNIIGNLLKNE